MAREGSLEAPTRHPLDWKQRRLLERRAGVQGDGAHLRHLPRLPPLREPVRIVPHAVRPGRRSKTMEVDGVDKKDYWKVVDQCYLCDLCYLTKCPYVPPHEWNLDFPHTMLRAKAIKFKKGEVGRREIAGLHRRARPVCRHSHRGAGGQCGQQDQVRAQR
jgi:glycerol-3-phosphate dehydrogenase subunit C